MEKIVLKNGISVLLKKKECQSVTIQVTFKVGSIYESLSQKGYSHLIEHVLFEGTTKRPCARDITSEIENIGGEINAMTSNEQTTYYVKVPVSYDSIGVDVLSDMVINPLFEEDKIEKEKRIVLEEIKMINDQPRYFQWLFFEKVLCENTPFEIPVYGFESVVSKATRKKLVAYYEKFYVPNNCVISIVGNYSENILSIIKKFFESWNTKKISKNSVALPKNKKRFSTIQKDITQVYMIKGYVVPSLTHKDSPALDVIESILGKPQSGRLYDKIRNTFGYAYDIGISYECFSTFGFIAINVGCEEKYAETVSKIIDSELESLKKKAVSKTELHHAKQYIKGKYLLDTEDTHKEADVLVTYECFAGKDLTETYLSSISAVTSKDVIRVAKKYFTNKMTQIRILPKNTL